MRWRKAAILGIGLLGGSLGMALRGRRLADEVAGLVRREAAIDEVVAAGAVDTVHTRVPMVVKGADLVVLCTPLAQMAALAAEFRGSLAHGAVVTDVGSAKVAVIEALERVVRDGQGRFVGSHPMAGSERTGVQAARADLFQDAVAVVTPTDASDADAVAAITELWRSVGARVLTMPAEHHDELVSRSSHLPHLLSAALAHWILAPGNGPAQADLCATGFRDTTRVASGSAEMWGDIIMANRGAILRAWDEWEASLSGLRSALEAGNAGDIEAFLRVAKLRRDDWCENGTRLADD